MCMDLTEVLKQVIAEQNTKSPIWSPTNPFFPRYGQWGAPRDYGPHWAVDVEMPSGTKLYAPHTGKIVYRINNKCGGGFRIESGPYTSLFCHMKSFAVTNGQWVKAGQYLGLSGGGKNDRGRGSATGPHLHWQFWVQGQVTNPYNGYVGPNSPLPPRPITNKKTIK